MGLQLPFNPVKSGLFYSLRLGGTWVAADYWIQYFNATSCTHTIRLENLEEDSNRYVLPLLPKGTKPLKFPRINTNQYSHKIEDFISKQDLKEFTKIILRGPQGKRRHTAVQAKSTQLLESSQKHVGFYLNQINVPGLLRRF